MTLFSPGHSPPQVTMPTRIRAGSKNRYSRGPPGSSEGSSLAGQPRATAMPAVSSSSTRSDSCT